MTRKHFEALAAALRLSKPDQPTNNGPDSRKWDWPTWEALSQWRADVRAIASVLLAHNPRFDTRFYAACGYEAQPGSATSEAEGDTS